MLPVVHTANAACIGSAHQRRLRRCFLEFGFCQTSSASMGCCFEAAACTRRGKLQLSFVVAASYSERQRSSLL